MATYENNKKRALELCALIRLVRDAQADISDSISEGFDLGTDELINTYLEELDSIARDVVSHHLPK